MARYNPDQSSLFGYISPVTGDVCSHPPLCACGECPCPVERFEVPAEHPFEVPAERPSDSPAASATSPNC